MKVKLEDIAILRSGYPFRKAVEEQENGAVSVIQIKDVSKDGVDWASVSRTELPGSLPTYWLENGDMLFMSRGKNNFAVPLKNVIEGETICTSHMFYIKLKSSHVIPEYLSIQLNTKQLQEYFTQHAKGAGKKHISKDVLKNVEIVVPPIQEQMRVVALEELFQQEKALIQDLVENNASITQSFIAGKIDNSIEKRREQLGELSKLADAIKQALEELN